MVSFVICEDEEIFTNKFKDIVSKFMMASDTEYKIVTFKGYNKEFEKFVANTSGYKIYMLDIKTKTGSGLDAVRMIREQYEDWKSMIMIITAYSEYRYEALASRLMLLDFINKLDNCEAQIYADLKRAMKNYDTRPKTLSYEYNRVANSIDFKDIIYIEKEQDSKRCIVHTKEEDFFVPRTLNEIEKLIDKRFFKVHRSLIINVDHLKRIDLKENKLIFKNGEYSYLISRRKKKELIEYVKVCN